MRPAWEAFVWQLLDDPGDGVTRLVYADWLDEQPEALGPLLAGRLRQYEQGQGQGEPDIAPALMGELTARFGPAAQRWFWREGGLGGMLVARLGLDDFLRWWGLLNDCPAILGLVVQLDSSDLVYLGEGPWRELIADRRPRVIGLDVARLFEEDWPLLAECPFLRGLRWLSLRPLMEVNGLLHYLAAAPGLECIESLELGCEDEYPAIASLVRLLTSPALPGLCHFSCGDAALDDVAAALMGVLRPDGGAAEVLDLSGVCGQDLVAALAACGQATHTNRARSLRLRHCGITDHAALLRLLASGPGWAGLRDLDLASRHAAPTISQNAWFERFPDDWSPSEIAFLSRLERVTVPFDDDLDAYGDSTGVRIGLRRLFPNARIFLCCHWNGGEPYEMRG